LAFRSDGKRIRGLDPYFEIIPYIMNKRVDAQNFFNAMIPLQPIDEYIKQKRLEGKKISHLGLLIAAYVRMASQNPEMNRFVVNKRIYGRNHFCVSFVTLTPIKKASTVNKIYFNLDDDIFTVNEKVTAAIENCQDKEAETAMDKLAKALVRFPGLLSVAVPIIRFVDKHLWLPMSIVHASPFHTSLFVTNLASIRVGAIYHHLYEFGTTGVFVAMGQPSKRTVTTKDGGTEERKFMELGIVTDERIADGHYYGQCFREWLKYLKNPEILEKKAESIVEDPDTKVKNKKWIMK